MYAQGCQLLDQLLVEPGRYSSRVPCGSRHADTCAGYVRRVAHNEIADAVS